MLTDPEFFAMKIVVPIFSLLSISLHSNAQDSIVYKLNQHFRIIDNSDYIYRRVIKKINDTTFQQTDYFRIGALLQQTLFKDKELKILNGKYIAFDGKGKITVTGYYYNNKPVHTWHFYNLEKNNQTDSLDYDFYSNLKKQFEQSHSIADSIKYNAETDNEATFPGGDKAWKRYLTRNLESFSEDFPSSKGKEIQIAFMVDKTGKLINIHPVMGINPTIDFEIVKIIRRSPKWSPAEQNGKRVIAIRTQPIHF